jgi:hypothetical protein
VTQLGAREGGQSVSTTAETFGIEGVFLSHHLVLRNRLYRLYRRVISPLLLVRSHDDNIQNIQIDHYVKTIFLPCDGNIRAPSFSFSFFFASHEGWFGLSAGCLPSVPRCEEFAVREGGLLPRA